MNPKFQARSPYYFKLHFHEIRLGPGGTFCKKDTLIGPVISKSDPSLYLHHRFIDHPSNYKIIIQIGKIDNVIIIDKTRILFKVKGPEIILEFPEIKI